MSNFSKEGKKSALLTHFAMRFLGNRWGQKFGSGTKVSFRVSTLRGYIFGRVLRGCVQNHAEIFCFSPIRNPKITGSYRNFN
jgi:hypothetical protein